MYDPYAPPQAQDPGPVVPSPLGGPSQPWTIGEVLATAFDRTRDQAVGVAVTYLVYLLLSTGFGFVIGVPIAVLHLPFEVAQIASQGLSLVVTSFLQVGLCRIAVRVARGERIEIGTLFSGGSALLSMFGAMLLYLVVVTLGLVALVVPGIVLAAGLSLYPYFVAEHGLGPVAALEASWKATTGARGRLFLLELALVVVVGLSALVLCVGVLFGMGMLACANALVFLRMTGTDPARPRLDDAVGPPGRAPW